MSADTRICPIHPGGPLELPLSEFGVCRARKDGKNLYCKSCIRTKVTNGRRSHRAWKAAQKKRRENEFELPDRKPEVLAKQKLDLPLIDGLSWWASLALWAIDCGASSQKQMMQLMRTKRKVSQLEDVLGLALVELFTHKLISSVGVAEERVYFRRKAA